MLRPVVPFALALLLGPSLAFASEALGPAADVVTEARSSAPEARGDRGGRGGPAVSRSAGRPRNEAGTRRSKRGSASPATGGSRPAERGSDRDGGSRSSDRGDSGPANRDEGRSEDADRSSGNDKGAPSDRGSERADGPRDGGPRDGGPARADGVSRGESARDFDREGVRPSGGATLSQPGPRGRDGTGPSISRPSTVTRSVTVGSLERGGTRSFTMDRGAVRADMAAAGPRTVAPSNFRTRGAARDRAAGGTRQSAERHGSGGHVRVDERAEDRAAERRAQDLARDHRRHGWHHDHRARHHAAWSHRHPRTHWYQPRGWFRPWHPYYGPRWYHGVFVYGPYPWYHHQVVVVDGDGGGAAPGADRAAAQEGPRRTVDRAKTFAVGVRGGSYLGGYDNGAVFGDAGLGIAARYRPVEAIGLELSWMHHDQTWADGSERTHEPVQASVQLFAAPWTKFNPYVLAGVTYTGRDVDDAVGTLDVEQSSPLWGPHGGVGLEFGVGKQASVNFDVRWAGYLNSPSDDANRAGAAQANMGVNFYF